MINSVKVGHVIRNVLKTRYGWPIIVIKRVRSVAEMTAAQRTTWLHEPHLNQHKVQTHTTPTVCKHKYMFISTPRNSFKQSRLGLTSTLICVMLVPNTTMHILTLRSIVQGSYGTDSKNCFLPNKYFSIPTCLNVMIEI